MTSQSPEALWVQKWISKQGIHSPFSLSRLAGDGSTRSFFRLSIDKKSLLLLWDPAWTLSQDYSAHQAFLKSNHIPVPEFYFEDPSAGALLMEDLGDVLLQLHIQKNPNQKIPLLEKSLLLLADLHGRTYPVPDNLPCAKRAFDLEKYSFELGFTLEHLSHHLFQEPKSESREVIREFGQRLEKVSPRCFSHRDYHTRNILFFNEALYLIDFQDARMGPPHYDLCSILYDAYLPLTEEERRKLLTAYQSRLKTFPLYAAMNWKTLQEDLALVGLQRTIKAAGSFASFYTRHQKTTHLPYLVPALTSALALRKQVSGLPADFDRVFPLENWLQRAGQVKIK